MLALQMHLAARGDNNSEQQMPIKIRLVSAGDHVFDFTTKRFFGKILTPGCAVYRDNIYRARGAARSFHTVDKDTPVVVVVVVVVAGSLLRGI